MIGSAQKIQHIKCDSSGNIHRIIKDKFLIRPMSYTMENRTIYHALPLFVYFTRESITNPFRDSFDPVLSFSTGRYEKKVGSEFIFFNSRIRLMQELIGTNREIGIYSVSLWCSHHALINSIPNWDSLMFEEDFKQFIKTSLLRLFSLDFILAFPGMNTFLTEKIQLTAGGYLDVDAMSWNPYFDNYVVPFSFAFNKVEPKVPHIYL